MIQSEQLWSFDPFKPSFKSANIYLNAMYLCGLDLVLAETHLRGLNRGREMKYVISVGRVAQTAEVIAEGILSGGVNGSAAPVHHGRRSYRAVPVPVHRCLGNRPPLRLHRFVPVHNLGLSTNPLYITQILGYTRSTLGVHCAQ